MKLKILAIVALAVVGIGAAFVALGGLPASAATTTQLPDRRGHHRRRHRRCRGDRHRGRERVVRRRVRLAGPPRGCDAASGSGLHDMDGDDVKVKVGDTVKKGAVLATADTTDLKRQLADANTALDDGQDPACDRQDRACSTPTTTTRPQIRQTRIGVNNAETQVSSATKTRDDLQTQIKLATLTAPIDGIVTTVNIVAGLDAPSGDAIVIDATTFQITTDVVESDLASMAVGQTATVSIAAVGRDRRPARSPRSPRPPIGTPPAASCRTPSPSRSRTCRRRCGPG